MSLVVFAGGGTGGHLYPAIAIADGLKRLRPEVESLFVGARGGVEARILPQQGRAHLLLRVRGLARPVLSPASIQTNGVAVAELALAVSSLLVAFRRKRPRAVVATGGYASAAAGIAAGIARIPLFVLEQNRILGRANRLLARFAARIFLGFRDARLGLPESVKRKTVVSGNPIRPLPRINRAEARRALEQPIDGALVLVSGGSQGARAINRLMLEVARLPGAVRGEVRILWSTGPAEYDAIQRELDRLDASRICALPYIDDMYAAYAAADVAVSRAGAITTTEQLAWGIPQVLIPLPTAAENHQLLNAEALAQAGAAHCLPEAGLTGRRLWRRVRAFLDDPKRSERTRALAKRMMPRNSIELISAKIATCLPNANTR